MVVRASSKKVKSHAQEDGERRSFSNAVSYKSEAFYPSVFNIVAQND